jgi:hypothetical protein
VQVCFVPDLLSEATCTVCSVQFTCGPAVIPAFEPIAHVVCIEKVSNSPPGTQGAQIDIKSAYRCIPVHFSQLIFLVVSCRQEGFVYIDRCHPFGLRSSGGNLGQALDATMDIICSTLGLAFYGKWVDDIIPIRTPVSSSDSHHRYDIFFDDIIKTFRILGWPLSTEKLHDFYHIVRYIGFDWNFELKTVSLPEEKRLKFKARVESWIANGLTSGVSAVDTEHLVGSLSHIACIHEVGQSFLPSLHNFLASFESRNRFITRLPPRESISDMRTWLSLLSIPDAFRALHPRATIDIDIWVDASTEFGIGLVVGHRWRAWKLKDGWKGERRDIGWAESVGLELATLEIASRGIRNARVVVFCDNQGSIGQFRRGRGRNADSNLCIRRSVETMMRSCFDIVPEYVRSADNRADAPSRGEGLVEGLRLARSFETPSVLVRFLSDV